MKPSIEQVLLYLRDAFTIFTIDNENWCNKLDWNHFIEIAKMLQKENHQAQLEKYWNYKLGDQ